uniref:Kallikrein related-peptidase 5 n=1 Tax=Mus spicilegus TaxID=10103 RepID=A0A8C6I1E6_MUSSI
MVRAGHPWKWAMATLITTLVLGVSEPVLAGDVSSCDNPSGTEPSGTNRDLNTDSKSGEDTRSDSSSRIVNGSDCQKDAQPWQGALLLGPNKLYCGAVLISPQWLLTAAHCRKPVFRIRLGHHSMSPVYESGQQMFQGIKSIPHPGYSHPGHSNDLMLIKMNRKIRDSHSVKPVEIACDCATEGTRCMVSGWGTTSSSHNNFPKVLQCLNITVLSEERCKNSYPGQIDKTMFCAGDEEGRDSCQGDSGGPVVCNGKLQGLVSWGDFPCAQRDRPGVYTNLCEFVKWIKDTMNSN